MEKDDGSKEALIIAVNHYDLLQPLTFCMNEWKLKPGIGYSHMSPISPFW